MSFSLSALENVLSLDRPFPPTLSRQVQVPLARLFPVEHLQGVFAFVIFCWVADFNPDFLRIAAGLRPGFLIDPLLSARKEAKTISPKICSPKTYHGDIYACPLEQSGELRFRSGFFLLFTSF